MARVTTFNAGGFRKWFLRRRRQIEADVRKIRNRSTIVLWQEVRGAYRGRIRALMPGWAHAYLWKSANPISWRRKYWRRVDGGKHVAHGGRAAVTPHREIVWVILRNRSSGLLVVFLSAHYITAWRRRRYSFMRWRRRRWNEMHDEHADLLDESPLTGLTAVGGADFNRLQRDIPRLGEWVAFAKIDGIYVRQGDDEETPGACVEWTRVRDDYYSDHPSVTVKLGWL